MHYHKKIVGGGGGGQGVKLPRTVGQRESM